MKKYLIFILALILLLTGCNNPQNNNDVVILFTSDVHCQINSNIGYDGLAAYKNKMESKNEHVVLVDLGDAIQGDFIGSISKGEYIIDIMNYLEYDYAILGNHEFDYGMNQTAKIMDKFNGTYLGCNIEYTGNKTNQLQKLQPYEIVSYGDINIAYIGVTTPYTTSTSTPSFFMEDGEYVYDFYSGENGNRLINKIQETINECKNKGADYIIGLTHLGSTEEDIPYSTQDIISNTTGFDVVLDGHSHIKVSSNIIIDKNGNDVILGCVGTAFDAIGQVLITPNNISVTFIDEYASKDAQTTQYVQSIINTYEADLNKKIITINKTLKLNDENNIRLIRTREIPMGNLMADAFRHIGGTDVGLINAGGIRGDLIEGDITYKDIHKISPFGNYLVTTYATGQEIIDSLEISVRSVKKEYELNGEAYGESGGFLQVSGLKFDVDTSIPSPVILDELENFIEIKGLRRVSNVKILINGEYVNIDPNETYTVATVDYIVKHGGCSNNIFTDNEWIIENGPFDYEILEQYLVNVLKGDLSNYTTTEGRININ